MKNSKRKSDKASSYLLLWKSDREGDDRIPEQQSKRRPGDSEVQIPMCFDIGSYIGELVRKVTREELRRRLPSSTSRAEPIYELRFVNKVACTIYTRSQIKSDDEDKFIQIELVDNRTQAIIREGPLSSVKIKICVLDAEIGSRNWTANQFDAHTLRPREGREPLLKGESLVRLQNGVATIRNLELTDNSRCTRSGKFKLGARVIEEPRTPHEEDIREGISDAFRVKEIRGRKKHNLPSSSCGQCSGTDQGLQLNFPIAHQDQLEPKASPPDSGQQSTPILYVPSNAESLAEFGGMLQDGPAWVDDLLSLPEMHEINGLLELPVEADSYSKEKGSNSKTRAVWYKIKNAFKWVISVRLEAAAKRRMAKPLQYIYI